MTLFNRVHPDSILPNGADQTGMSANRESALNRSLGLGGYLPGDAGIGQPRVAGNFGTGIARLANTDPGKRRPGLHHVLSPAARAQLPR